MCIKGGGSHYETGAPKNHLRPVLNFQGPPCQQLPMRALEFCETCPFETPKEFRDCLSTTPLRWGSLRSVEYGWESSYGVWWCKTSEYR